MACVANQFPAKAQTTGEKMYAHVIDVGQGLSVLLEFPKGAVLIDAGAAPDREVALITYLKNFFQRRPDLNNTLNSVFITHQHIDHDIALDDLTRNFKILNYLDNGRRRVTITEVNHIWMQDHYSQFGCKYEAITFDKIAAIPQHTDLTDDLIDAVGGTVDPKITVYSGAFVARPTGWSDDTYNDPNNNSMVIKVTFGSASFLFSGDLEETGIAQVLNLYAGTNALKADVMQVGHHGSRNAITTQWISTIKPKYAFISCGHWDDGRLPNGKPKIYTTYAYAHPHIESVQILEDSLTATRPVAFTATVGTKGSYMGSIPQFTTKTIHKTYATPWDGTIVVTATSTGQYTFATHQ
ncbi:Metal-dependent hydrolase, beta-lactamase superfamily II [Mucilaginibacter gossypii]|uniref:Metal-dependent hydrolase, beta-lactamase superfamily II n=2 Tax=Mucilaginibacter gossypii TaxID=551996 RepID=A0A1G8CYI4_9SPHI|nr:Metal-dependent hydrolase, beta-lactamase superfamily II [Mucilaginibacter gossypii]